MRVAVIRGDLPGPLFIADLEPTSQGVPSMDRGQTRYLSRPDLTKIQAYLDGQALAASASALVTATVPVGGPVNVSSTTIKSVTGLAGATNAQVTALQDLLAPQFVETAVANNSWTHGNLKRLRDASFTPDPNRFSTGAAIVTVEDDGSTAYAP